MHRKLLIIFRRTGSAGFVIIVPCCSLSPYPLTIDGKLFDIAAADVTIKREQRSVTVEDIVPSVIEPSFGINRIMFAVFEHNFRARVGGDELRQFIALPPLVAPIKCSILPLSGKAELKAFVESVCEF